MSKQLTLAVKKEVSRRAGGLCEDCNKASDWRGLSYHHVKLKQMGGTRRKYTTENVLLLCGKCHSKRHGIKEV